nr:uncharacterized protein LOC129383971 [Dermacentor andersoni]
MRIFGKKLELLRDLQKKPEDMQVIAKMSVVLLLCLMPCSPSQEGPPVGSTLSRSQKTDYSGQFLTPLIERKAVKSARDASFVKMFKMRANATAYSGFITINKEQQANLYFIYMQAQVRKASEGLVRKRYCRVVVTRVGRQERRPTTYPDGNALSTKVTPFQ